MILPNAVSSLWNEKCYSVRYAVGIFSSSLCIAMSCMKWETDSAIWCMNEKQITYDVWFVLSWIWFLSRLLICSYRISRFPLLIYCTRFPDSHPQPNLTPLVPRQSQCTGSAIIFSITRSFAIYCTGSLQSIEKFHYYGNLQFSTRINSLLSIVDSEVSIVLFLIQK
jgi:hypothetical protein